MNKSEIIEIMKENDIDIDYKNIQNKTFEDLGVDSVDFMMILFSIKTKYNVDLSPEKNITIEQMVDKIKEKLN